MHKQDRARFVGQPQSGTLRKIPIQSLDVTGSDNVFQGYSLIFFVDVFAAGQRAGTVPNDMVVTETSSFYGGALKSLFDPLRGDHWTMGDGCMSGGACSLPPGAQTPIGEGGVLDVIPGIQPTH